MRQLATLARRNPYVVIGVAALVGWALGSGLVPIALPSLGRAAPTPASPATAGSPPAPAAPSFAMSSASMPPPATAPSDPLGGWNI